MAAEVFSPDNLELFLFFSYTPVVGIAMKPSKTLPIHRLKWYRLIGEVVCCSLHPRILAKHECGYCGLGCRSCDMDCFHQQWKNHHCSTPSVGKKKKERLQKCPQQFPKPIWVAVKDSFPEVSNVPTHEDVGYKLVVECWDGGLEKVFYVLTDDVIEKPTLIIREMLPIDDGSQQGPLIRVVTYNVLGDSTITKTSFKHCKERYALTWEYRSQSLLEEITRYDADVICLQEVQGDRFLDFFEPSLDILDYTGLLKEKTAFNMGVAIFYRRTRFTLIETVEMEFKTLADLAYAALIEPKVSGDHILKDNVALILQLKDNKTETTFIVANTHVYFKRQATDTKLWQVATLLNKLETIWDSTFPIILCGDLNSSPKSAAYDLIVSGTVDQSHKDWKHRSESMFKFVKLDHGLGLASAYSAMANVPGHCHKLEMTTKEPNFTISSPSLKDTLDYIFYSAFKVKVKGLLDLLDDSATLPSVVWPSDHIALMADFELLCKLDIEKAI